MDDNEINGNTNPIDNYINDVDAKSKTQIHFSEENNIAPPFPTVMNERVFYGADFSENFSREDKSGKRQMVKATF